MAQIQGLEQANVKKELLKLTKVQLIRRCKMVNLATNGRKSEMIDRLISKHNNISSSIKRNKQTKGSKQYNLSKSKSVDPTIMHYIDKFQLKPTTITKLKRKSMIVRSVKSKKTSKKKSRQIRSYKYKTFGIGGNCFGEFGLEHTNSLKQLTNINKSKSISNIYNGYQYTIYSDNKNNKYWSSGYNSSGQCTKYDEWTTTHKQIEYVNKRKLLINKVCVNVGGSCTFWITSKGTVYGHGRNDSFQLGLGDKNNRNKPTLIKKLNNIIDVQSAHSYSVALSSMDHIITQIVHYWSMDMIISVDITHLITEYTQSNTVYSTSHSFYGGNGQTQNDDDKECKEWKEMEIFQDRRIIQIRTGSEHTLFLEDNGSLWSCGDGAFFQLGLGHDETVYIPTEIKWFKQNNIKIVDMECGLYHCLALDENGNCYSWGYSKRGQCGNGMDGIDMEYIGTPQIITYFHDNGIQIKKIGCGNFHSFCRDINGKCYLFGSNQHNQCITFDARNKVDVPFCIDNIVEEKTKKKVIKGVYLGCNNTKIIVY